jgi:methylmalonyl-CoA mutase cobalamin-binding subunit
MTSLVRYPIGYVSRRTGLTAHTIRAWENRYHAVTPVRTGTNRRGYSEADLERLLLLKEAVDAGIRIGDVAYLTTADLTKLVGHLTGVTAQASSKSHPPPPDGSVMAHVDAGVSAALDLDADGLLGILTRAATQFTRPIVIDGIVVPLIQKLGDLWNEGSMRIAHEHLASAVLRTYLGDMLRFTHVSQSAPAGIFATPLAQLHELGALIAAVVAASREWRTTYLGANLPAEEIAAAAASTQARVVGLSIVHPEDDPRLIWELRKLRQSLGEGITVIVGGRAAHAYGEVLETVGAFHLQDLQTFRHTLESLRSEPAA